MTEAMPLQMWGDSALRQRDSFCAGWLQEVLHANHCELAELHERLTTIRRVRTPMVAAVHGAAPQRRWPVAELPCRDCGRGRTVGAAGSAALASGRIPVRGASDGERRATGWSLTGRILGRGSPAVRWWPRSPPIRRGP